MMARTADHSSAVKRLLRTAPLAYPVHRHRQRVRNVDALRGAAQWWGCVWRACRRRKAAAVAAAARQGSHSVPEINASSFTCDLQWYTIARCKPLGAPARRQWAGLSA